MKKTLLAVSLAAAGLVSAVAQAQQYPSKPIKFIAPGPGGLDIVARQFLPALGTAMGQQIIIENKPGGTIPGHTVMTAPADGYTLLFAGGSHWLAPLAVKDAPYDPVKDFAAVVMIYFQPYVMVVNTGKLNINSVKELIAAAKARPGQINMGAGSPASSGTLSGTLFKQMADVDVVAIPYKTGSARASGLLSGEIDFDFLSGAGTEAFLKSGKTRAIAVSSKKPSPSFPGLQAIADTVPDYEYGSTTAVFAPAKTPAAIVTRLNQEFNKLLKAPETAKILTSSTADPMGGTVQEAGDFIRRDYARMEKVLKAVGFKPE